MLKQDEIIEMAKQSGMFEITKDGYEVFYPDNLEAFAKLVAAKEREACAKVCETVNWYDSKAWASDIAKAIRARGTET